VFHPDITSLSLMLLMGVIGFTGIGIESGSSLLVIRSGPGCPLCDNREALSAAEAIRPFISSILFFVFFCAWCNSSSFFMSEFNSKVVCGIGEGEDDKE